MIRTFADANVIIAFAKGKGHEAEAAISLIRDPDRDFLASVFLEMELKPKPLRDGDHAQIETIHFYLQHCEYAENLDTIVKIAYDEMLRTNLKVLDALHLAAAYVLEADELVTLESSKQRMYGNHLVQVVRLV